MKYICMDCSHEFDEPGRTYDELDRWCNTAIGACPQCLSCDYTLIAELEVKPVPPIEVKPVSTANLEAQARKVLRSQSRPMDENINYRRDMIAAGRGHLLK